MGSCVIHSAKVLIVNFLFRVPKLFDHYDRFQVSIKARQVYLDGALWRCYYGGQIHLHAVFQNQISVSRTHQSANRTVKLEYPLKHCILMVSGVQIVLGSRNFLQRLGYREKVNTLRLSKFCQFFYHFVSKLRFPRKVEKLKKRILTLWEGGGGTWLPQFLEPYLNLALHL